MFRPLLRFLDKENTVASPDFNRFKLLPVALSIHLCIGQIYAFSVFNQPMTRILGISQSSSGDWQLTQIGWIFSLALFFLGASAAIFGKWVERVGPRKTMFYSVIFFSGGFLISALGISIHNIWVVYLGSGVIGGIGLGLGYISPVSTLIRWFPDRPGMATGMAIMGFGGGAMIASPVSVYLMEYFSSDASVGVAETFIMMGLAYAIIMSYGVFNVRIAPADYRVEENQGNVKSNSGVEADVAVKTRQFYYLFFVLMLNVTAGIGVLGQASVMIQESFDSVDAAFAAGFVGILSLFNMIGRLFWSSLSDYIGRKNTYTIFFVLGSVLFLCIPLLSHSNKLYLFIATFCVVLSMYGGGFATIPAYIRDVFGTYQVGAIHGRLLLAWSTAALLGPSIINYMRQYQIDVLKRLPSQAYDTTLYIMAGVLILGLISNLMIKPVDEKYYRTEGDG